MKSVPILPVLPYKSRQGRGYKPKKSVVCLSLPWILNPTLPSWSFPLSSWYVTSILSKGWVIPRPRSTITQCACFIVKKFFPFLEAEKSLKEAGVAFKAYKDSGTKDDLLEAIAHYRHAYETSDQPHKQFSVIVMPLPWTSTFSFSAKSMDIRKWSHFSTKLEKQWRTSRLGLRAIRFCSIILVTLIWAGTGRQSAIRNGHVSISILV